MKDFSVITTSPETPYNYTKKTSGSGWNIGYVIEVDKNHIETRRQQTADMDQKGQRKGKEDDDKGSLSPYGDIKW